MKPIDKGTGAALGISVLMVLVGVAQENVWTFWIGLGAIWIVRWEVMGAEDRTARVAKIVLGVLWLVGLVGLMASYWSKPR